MVYLFLVVNLIDDEVFVVMFIACGMDLSHWWICLICGLVMLATRHLLLILIENNDMDEHMKVSMAMNHNDRTMHTTTRPL